MRLAGIDIGTLTCRLLVADVSLPHEFKEIDTVAELLHRVTEAFNLALEILQYVIRISAADELDVGRVVLLGSGLESLLILAVERLLPPQRPASTVQPI